MDVHIGKEIEKKYDESGLKLSDFAKKINTGTRNVYSIFKRSDINSALLKKIGEALNFDFFQLYQKEYKKKGLSSLFLKASEPELTFRNRKAVTVSIELDGSQNTMEYWLETIKKLNAAL